MKQLLFVIWITVTFTSFQRTHLEDVTSFLNSLSYYESSNAKVFPCLHTDIAGTYDPYALCVAYPVDTGADETTE